MPQINWSVDMVRDGELVPTGVVNIRNIRGHSSLRRPDAMLNDDVEENPILATNERIAIHLENLHEAINRQNWRLILTSWEGMHVQYVEKPKASHIPHTLLFPPVYQSVKGIASLEHLANLLRTPPGWREAVSRVLRDPLLINRLRFLRHLPAAAFESDVHSAFVGMAYRIADVLGLFVHISQQSVDRVGGLLADETFDIASETDVFVLNRDNVCVFSTEIKTSTSFPQGDNWYRDTRGAQSFCSLYSKNAPLFLFNQEQWKALVENEARDEVLTYPFGVHDPIPFVNSLEMEPMGASFVEALAICMLSRPTYVNDGMREITPPVASSSPKRELSIERNEERSPKRTVKQPRVKLGKTSSGQVKYRQLRVYVTRCPASSRAPKLARRQNSVSLSLLA